MIAVFYDTKNKCEVDSSQLMQINYVTHLHSDDMHDPGSNLGFHTLQLGNIGWKSPKCSKHCNWDMWTLESNLVFLRLEDNNATYTGRPEDLERLQERIRQPKGGKRVLRLVKQTREKRQQVSQKKKKEDWKVAREYSS